MRNKLTRNKLEELIQQNLISYSTVLIQKVQPKVTRKTHEKYRMIVMRYFFIAKKS